MSLHIKIDAKKLPGALAKRNAAVAVAVMEGLKIGAQRSRTFLVGKTPYDEGTLSAAWDVRATNKKLGKGKGKFEAISIVNDQPYAGVVERGARPHQLGRVGIQALAGWAKRKFGVSDAEARSIAFAIRQKLKTKGQKGTYFVRDSVDDIGEMTMKEVVRRLQFLAGRGDR